MNENEERTQIATPPRPPQRPVTPPPYGGRDEKAQYVPAPQPKNNNTLLYVVIALLAVIVVGLVVFFVVGGNDKKTAPVDSTQTASTAVAKDTVAAPSPAPVAEVPQGPTAAPDQYNQSLRLKGAIGKYGIVVDMDVTNGNISGSYYYTRMGSKARLAIIGTYDPSSGYMHIYEIDNTNGYTGEFTGTFDGISFSGTMTAYLSGKTYNTYLKKTR